MHDYNLKARIYWWALFSIGLALLVKSAVTIAGFAAPQLIQLAMAICFTAIVGYFPVTIPRTKVCIAGGEIFIFLTLLLLGVEAAAWVVAAEGLVGSLRASKRWTSWFGTPTMAAISMSAAGSLFILGRDALTAQGWLNGGALLLLLTIFALCYFALNICQTSALLALKRNEPIKPLAWLKEMLWVALAYVGSAAIAAMLYQAGTSFGFGVVLAGAPIILLFLTSAHFIFERSKTEQHVQTALLDAANRETELAHAHVAALEKSERRFHGAFTNAAIGMALVSPNGAILQVNAAACRMLGYRERELIGGAIGVFMPPDDFSLLLNDMDSVTDSHEKVTQRELNCIGKSGVAFSVAFGVSIFDEGEGGSPDLIVQLQDIRARKAAENKLLHIAFHDALTGLVNRAYFREQLARVLARTKRNPTAQYALMFLDFDRFKAVNDSLGHAVGDELLIGFAVRIKAVFRPTDTVARLGGDEFAILIEDVKDDSHVIELAKRLQDTFRAPFPIQGNNITSSASIGIAFGSVRHDSPDDVIRDADLAMYKAKHAGKAQYAVFDSSLHDRATAELQLENELRRAIEIGELRVHYQAQYGLRDRVLYGYEALVRWAHPTRGLLYPSSFLPIAEETGLVVPLGKWVIEEVCKQMQRLRQTEQGASIHMTINVSSRELRQQQFATTVLTALKNAGVSGKFLTLDLSERALIDGGRTVVEESLSALRAAGVTLCIDNFGTGFSSLSHLASLPIDSIKIDRGFVHQAEQTNGAKEIVRAITSLGRALGKSVHAQGVETEAQWRILAELGCDVAQGNVRSPPISAAELNQVMATSRVIRAS